MPTLNIFGIRRSAPLLLAFLTLSGCGGDDPKDTLPRVAVGGSVTVDGQPLPQGSIQFNPTKGDQGTMAVGDIKDGKYSIDKAQGPVPGKYSVVISSRPQINISANQDPGPRPKVEAEKIPAQYNTKTTLEHEITAASPNTADFELKGKK